MQKYGYVELRYMKDEGRNTFCYKLEQMGCQTSHDSDFVAPVQEPASDFVRKIAE